MRYNRKLSRCAVTLLKPKGELAFLAQDFRTIVPGDPYALDLQLREKNTLMYYHGTTRLLCIQFKGPKISCSANKAYPNTSGLDTLFQKLTQHHGSVGKPALLKQLRQAVRNHLKKALSVAKPRYYANRKEGYWQNRLCIDQGLDWNGGRIFPWIVIDRECVLGFDDSSAKKSYYQKKQSPLSSIVQGLQGEDPARWGKLKKDKQAKKFGDELDLLAIGRNGTLWCIELKHGTNGSGIYWGPLQAELYRAAFDGALSRIEQDIKELVEQKVELKLLPREARTRIAKHGIKNVRHVLLVAEPNWNSTCWANMDIVRDQLQKNRPPVMLQTIV